jgi:hydrogenase nickel incorporation protein HypA/HybF
MHERALMIDLMRKIEEVAAEGGASRVVRVSVRLGPLSHFTPAHFREHFVDASRGTIAEGAQVDAVVDGDITGELARDVVLEDVVVELPEPSNLHEQAGQR